MHRPPGTEKIYLRAPFLTLLALLKGVKGTQSEYRDSEVEDLVPLMEEYLEELEKARTIKSSAAAAATVHSFLDHERH